jgi:glucose/arabinose dehydrogenase
MDIRILTHLLSGAICLGTLLPASAQKVENKVIKESLQSEEGKYKVVQVVSGIRNPWAMAWLPDGRMLVTQRAGQLFLVDGEKVSEVKGTPNVYMKEDRLSAPAGGNQGGLLDVVVHPNYATNGWIYFTYSSPGDPDGFTGGKDKGTGTAVARARLSADGSRLEDLETIYGQAPKSEPGRHYGSRIVFPGDGTLIFSIGDRGLRYPAQDLTHPAGSMVRIKEHGGVPEDNPFIGMPPGNIRPEIWSFGHRNNQGMALHPGTGDLWATEHGPKGGDLLHRVQAGKNYGWPIVAVGVEYSTGEMIGVGQEAPGVERPVHVWKEQVAPSGLAFYTGDAFPGWKGNLFAGFLRGQQVSRLVIKDGAVTHEEVLLKGEIGRIRDVRQGPDGFLYVATDEKDGGVYRLEPVR